MTVLLGRKQVGVALKYNQSGNASINNQDKTITENGVYTADEGYTGLGTVTVEVEGSGNGKPIEALNASGKALTKGDKVWLNEYTRTGDTFYNFIKPKDSNNIGFLDATGLFAWGGGKFYSLGDNSATELLSASGYQRDIFYTSDGAVISDGAQSVNPLCIKGGNFLVIQGGYKYIQGSDNLFWQIGSGFIHKIDLTTGEILQTLTVDGLTTTVVSRSVFKRGNDFYICGRKYTLLDDGTFSDGTYFKQIPSDAYLTKDNKYLITVIKGYLQVYRADDNDVFELMPETFLPEEFRNITNYDYLVYNPNNGIFSMVKKGGTEFIIGKYENDTFTKLSFTIPLDELIVGDKHYQYFYGIITLSEDLSRMLITTSYSSSTFSGAQFIFNLTSNNGYVAVPYKTYAVSQDSITGVVTDNAEFGQPAQVLINGTINEDIIITENGEYEPSSSSTGFGKVTVNVANNSSSIIMQKFNGQCHCILPDSTTGIVDGFTADKYIVFPATITDGCTMTFKIETGDDITNFQNFYLGMFEGYVSQSIIGIWIGSELMVTKINPNTIYYVKVRIEDSILYASYSLDGVAYSDEVSGSIDLTDPAYSENRLGVGLYSNRYFRGKIHLNGCYIEKFGYPVWKPFMNIQQMNGYIYNYQSVYGENFQILGTNGDITYAGDLYIPIKPSVQPDIVIPEN